MLCRREMSPRSVRLGNERSSKVRAHARGKYQGAQALLPGHAAVDAPQRVQRPQVDLLHHDREVSLDDLTALQRVDVRRLCCA